MDRRNETRLEQRKRNDGRSMAEKTFLFLIGLWVLQMLYYYPLMPGTMASHFDGAGNPNGWSSRESFFGLSFGMLVLFTLLFHVLPRNLHRFPDSLVNMPNKDYWLAPERRAESFAGMRDRLMVFGCATALFLIGTFQLVMQANLTGGGRLPSDVMWAMLAVYILFTAVWTVQFMRSFRRPKTQRTK